MKKKTWIGWTSSGNVSILFFWGNPSDEGRKLEKNKGILIFQRKARPDELSKDVKEVKIKITVEEVK